MCVHAEGGKIQEDKSISQTSHHLEMGTILLPKIDDALSITPNIWASSKVHSAVTAAARERSDR